MTIGDNKDVFRVLLYSYSTTITGVGGPPKVFYTPQTKAPASGGFSFWGFVVSVLGFRV